MNSSIFNVLVFVALVGCVMARSIANPGSNVDDSEVGSTIAPESSEQQQEVQEELAEQKFNEMFGNGVDVQASESSEQQQPKDTYFGVDANDKEAVKDVQKELADQKFKEMFGNDVDIQEFNFYDVDEAGNAPVNGKKRSGSLIDGIRFLMQLFSKKQAPKKED